MSYIRVGSPFKYVEGTSLDYVFPTSKGKSKRTVIEDYGDIDNACLVDFICRAIDGDYASCNLGGKFDKTFRTYLKKKVAKRLGVKLRKRVKFE